MTERSKETTMTDREPVIRLDDDQESARQPATLDGSQSEMEMSGQQGEAGNDNDQKMSRAEAGRKGGLSTKKRYGDDYFRQIGRMGGKKGGEATKRKYGVEFYQEIGRKGGSK